MLVIFKIDYVHKSQNWKAGEDAELLPAFAKTLERQNIIEIKNEARAGRGISAEDYEALQEALKNEAIREAFKAEEKPKTPLSKKRNRIKRAKK
jgi:hypothetical protein